MNKTAAAGQGQPARESNINAIVSYFESGIKAFGGPGELGIELEQIIVHDDMSPVSYSGEHGVAWVLRQLEAGAPGRNNTMQLDFDTVEAYNNPSVPSEVVEKLHNVDIETLTPLEALNFLYELKNTLDKD